MKLKRFTYEFPSDFPHRVCSRHPDHEPEDKVGSSTLHHDDRHLLRQQDQDRRIRSCAILGPLSAGKNESRSKMSFVVQVFVVSNLSIFEQIKIQLIFLVTIFDQLLKLSIFLLSLLKQLLKECSRKKLVTNFCIYCLQETLIENRQMIDDLGIKADDKETLNAAVFSGLEEMFAFDRTVSRLTEMQTKEYWKKWKTHMSNKL